MIEKMTGKLFCYLDLGLFSHRDVLSGLNSNLWKCDLSCTQKKKTQLASASDRTWTGLMLWFQDLDVF